MTRVLIADDQTLFLDMLCTIIASYPGFEIAARCKDGLEAVEQFQLCRPDVCLLDIQMEGMGGIEALKRMKGISPDAKVIMLTTFSDDDNILDAFRLYADGYILKDVKPASLIQSLQCVSEGLVCMNKGVMKILNGYLSEGNKTNAIEMNADIGFHEKDIEIIRLIGEGLSNRLIAQKMNYSEGTIRNRISAILAETGLKDRTQIALFAIKNRLV